MHPSILLSVLLSPAVLALVIPTREEAQVPLMKRFNVPGASRERGFTIPVGIPEGMYRVTIDDDGVAHHTRVEKPGAGANLSPAAVALPLDTPTTAAPSNSSAPLDARQNSWSVTCADYDLDRNDADTVIRTLKWACGSGADLRAGDDFYSKYGNVVVYFCNTSRSTTYECTEDLIGEELQGGGVSHTCGAYRAGWSNWGGEVSIGYERVNSNLYWCGKNH
ncbi:hypothetical protein PspLS_11019 [Pyricularia sp. CBS 133598]|nr:hypothetical protein PspLS_11019 [Pyricularia sp. CBS 133598]